jgi:hypothetical protein
MKGPGAKMHFDGTAAASAILSVTVLRLIPLPFQQVEERAFSSGSIIEL